MTDRVRILLLIKGLGIGGAERIVAVSAPALERAGCDVEVGYVSSGVDRWVPTIAEAGVRVHCFGSDGAARHLWPLRLQRLLAARRYDVVHTHSPLVGAMARVLPGGRNSIMVHTEHNVWQSYRPLTRMVNGLTTGRNSRVFAVSDGVAASLRTLYWAPWVDLPSVEVLYHGIEETEVHSGPAARAAGRVRLGFGDETTLLVSVGNLSPKKDHRTLLEAFALVHRRRPDAVLVVIGDGPLHDDLRHRADELGVRDGVRFLGQRDDVAHLLPAFDGFVLSSRHEGLPLALLEAMASGLPVVATRVGGVPEVISHDRNGLMVAPGDPDALADAIDSILGDEAGAARLATAGKVTSGAFSIRRSVERTEVVYRELLTGR